jgi:hypothetical protein
MDIREPRLRADPTFPPASSLNPPTLRQEEKFGAGETVWEGSSSSLSMSSVGSGRYPSQTLSLPGLRKKQKLWAPHPLPNSSSPGDRRARAPLDPLCQVEPRRDRDEHPGSRTSLPVLCGLSWAIDVSGLELPHVSEDEPLMSRLSAQSWASPRHWTLRKTNPSEPRGERETSE